MKARIKLVEQTFNREIRSGDIVDIEIYGEPKDVSPDLGMGEEETLEEKMLNAISGETGSSFDMGFSSINDIAKIAKEHFQKHPGEINSDLFKEGYNDGKNYWRLKGMVSIDSVLKVFDNATIKITQGSAFEYIRKAIEDMKG